MLRCYYPILLTYPYMLRQYLIVSHKVQITRVHRTTLLNDRTSGRNTLTIKPGFTNCRSISLGALNELIPRWSIIAALLVYLFFIYENLGSFFFSKEWTTDDALQQAFPLLDVLYPGRFSGDLIAETMKGYLAPAHLWVSEFFTWLCGDVIMATHWVEAVQVLGCLLFLYLAVSKTASGSAALFAILWFIHTRPALQRLIGGLPRGWSGVVLAATLYGVFARRHLFMHVVLVFGCITSPPATMIAALTYGLSLLLDVLDPKARTFSIRPLLTLTLLSPFYVGLVLWVVARPESVGQMVDFATASAMPEFQRPHGRFPFLPLDPISWDLRMYAYQPFLHRLFDPGQGWKRLVPWLLVSMTGVLFVLGLIRKRLVFPRALLAYLISIVIVYSLSRLLAFKLYVPNRHLQIPMTLFWITWFSVAVSNLFHPTRFIKSAECSARSPRNTAAKPRVGAFVPEICSGIPLFIGYLFLSLIVWQGTSHGLYGTANYNYSRSKKGEVFNWIRENTAPNAMFAGHPTHIDGLPLFGERRTYATTETTHPFYPVYYAEMKRRLEISLRAHYALSLREVVDILKPEGIDYFVFSKKRFYPDALKSEEFFSPLDTLLKDLTSNDSLSYAYKQLPTVVDDTNKAFMPFRDEQSVVVNVKALDEWLTNNSSLGSAPSENLTS